MIAPASEPVIEGASVKSRPFTSQCNGRAPIGTFYRSVSTAEGKAIVLTGTGSDGAIGDADIASTVGHEPGAIERALVASSCARPGATGS